MENSSSRRVEAGQAIYDQYMPSNRGGCALDPGEEQVVTQLDDGRYQMNPAGTILTSDDPNAD